MYSTKEDNRPAILFYVNDWIVDMRGYSLEARGLWIEMLCLMHKSPKRGYLIQANFQATSKQDLSSILGVDIKAVEKAWQELEYKNVFSITDDKIAYCRRMVKEQELKEQKIEAGRKGGIISSKHQAERSSRSQATLENEYEDTIENENDINIKQGLLVLSTIESYPHNPQEDLGRLKELQKEFPDVNFVEAIKGWKYWLMDNRVKNYRASLRERFKHARQFREKAEGYQKIIDKGKEEDRKQEIKAKEALHRDALPIEKQAIKAGEVVKMLKGGGEKVKEGESDRKAEKGKGGEDE